MQPERVELDQEVHDLAIRVERLERALGIAPQLAAPSPAIVKESASKTLETTTTLETTALLPVLGRALLGLAGAYLLRALTESGTFAPKAGVGVGLLYAILWLALAARTPAARPIEAAVHSLTSVLVLSPLLWEATIRFHAIPTWTAGAILVFFTVFGLAVSWRKDLLIVATIATLAGLGTSGALLMATHDVLPFTLVFLAIAAAVEASACLEHWLSERWLAAFAADGSVLLATWLVTNAHGLPPAYVPIPNVWLLAVQVALLGIYLSSTVVRTLLRGFTFTVFETAQIALVFGISVGGGLRPSITLACGAACYLVSFVVLDRPGSRLRNFYTYSTFGLLLTVAGTRLLLPDGLEGAVWMLLAIACAWAAGSFGRLTLQVHGGMYLLLGIVSSGALAQATAFVLGASSWPAAGDLAMAGGVVAGAICYWRTGQSSSPAAQGVRLAAAATVAWLLAGATAGLLTAAYHNVAGADATHAYCATIRTGIVAAGALLLAWGGSRWNNLEWSRLTWPAMLLGAWRLLMLDLHQDRKAALFLSLLMFGAALMALPRLRRSRTVSGATVS